MKIFNSRTFNRTLSFALTAFILLGTTPVLAGNSSPLPIAIRKITLGAMENDASNEVSMIIKFSVNQSITNAWQIGFYMPQTFLKSGTVNAHLTMQICDENHACVNLAYQKSKHVSEPDKSAGYTTILAPEQSFSLLKGKDYTINLLHNNVAFPTHYSDFPQNFFLLLDGALKNLPTDASTYELLKYNPADIAQKIEQHLSSNWSNSAPLPKVSLPVVPSLVSYTPNSGSIDLTKGGLIIRDQLSKDNKIAALFKEALEKDLKIHVLAANAITHSYEIIIQKLMDPNAINNNLEGYQIDITPQKIYIYALNDTGAFYALQTLRQLWYSHHPLSCAHIVDYPRFAYRGLMLDSARHFFTVEEVKHVLDLMAAHKLNTLHLHLSDDEGFRIRLADYPTLASIGGSRGYKQNIAPMLFLQGNLDITNIAHRVYPYADTLYSYTYSADDIKRIVTYANEHKITVLAELDIPGHVHALVKALPSLLVDPNDQSQFVSIQGFTDNVLPVCTYNANSAFGHQFTATMDNIFRQTADLFNHQTTLYALANEVSLGGDEVSANAWTQDSSCQGKWANLSALEKSHLFFQDVAKNNPTLLISGWQQLVQNDDDTLGHDIVPVQQTGHVFIWNLSADGIGQAISMIQHQYPTVLAFSDQTYFDLIYTPDIHQTGFAWATTFSDTHAALSAANSAGAVLQELSNNDQAKLLGIEGALWSENITTYNHLIYMALPKMAGLSEASWSPANVTVNEEQQVNWQSLAQRLGCGKQGFLAYLNDLYHTHYRGYPNGIALEVPSTICNVGNKANL